MNSRLRWVACAAVLPAVLVFSGCDQTIDAGDLEQYIAKNVKQQVGQDVKVKCPSDIVAKKGKTLTCTVTLTSGALATATVTLLDDKGQFTYAITAGGPAPAVTTPPAATAPAATTP